ncbi:hypothetical protein FNV43_RR14494 [Rhamnella rubrinervis]|uniref:Uncharacterized protein n=1 Tax=Rhamnella rubrinervis TaxID=2594499 RepID=A0A8K0MGA6_9ROSA|nr:hypothetical protein FNV43_RR14494 [Rhamnella rubrinervis]
MGRSLLAWALLVSAKAVLGWAWLVELHWAAAGLLWVGSGPGFYGLWSGRPRLHLAWVGMVAELCWAGAKLGQLLTWLVSGSSGLGRDRTVSGLGKAYEIVLSWAYLNWAGASLGTWIGAGAGLHWLGLAWITGLDFTRMVLGLGWGGLGRGLVELRRTGLYWAGLGRTGAYEDKRAGWGWYFHGSVGVQSLGFISDQETGEEGYGQNDDFQLSNYSKQGLDQLSKLIRVQTECKHKPKSDDCMEMSRHNSPLNASKSPCAVEGCLLKGFAGLLSTHSCLEFDRKRGVSLT